jgi:hypothetical protein
MPMYENYNLFLAVGTAVSVFLVMQHVGHAVIRYLNRYQSCIVKNKSKGRRRNIAIAHGGRGWRGLERAVCSDAPQDR